MDILGPFSPGKGQVKFLIVAVDYFTKWIEAKPLTTITAQQVQQVQPNHSPLPPTRTQRKSLDTQLSRQTKSCQKV